LNSPSSSHSNLTPDSEEKKQFHVWHQIIIQK